MSVPCSAPALEEKLRAAWSAATFVKITLSEPDGADKSLRNLKARPVELKEGRRLCVVQCFATRELTQNHEPHQGIQLLCEALATGWRRAHLFTTAGDFQFRRERNGQILVRASRPAFTQAPVLEHDRRDPARDALASAPFLQKLGVTNAQGRPRPGMSGKLRQVQRFVELLGHLLEEAGSWEGKTVRIADMGAGKGYLTFALAHTFAQRGWKAHITGVEARPELVADANRTARELEAEGLEFVAGRIGEWTPPGPLDVLVALHACNTATDDALYQGVQSGAALLVTSPCCHQELRPQMRAPSPLGEILRHGILEERQAEILTDALRADLLELCGYRARVFEFVEPEHSGKNLMLAAVQRASGGRPAREIREGVHAALRGFGIQTQRLAALLGELPV